jgi:hypothetical protein
MNGLLLEGFDDCRSPEKADRYCGKTHVRDCKPFHCARLSVEGQRPRSDMLHLVSTALSLPQIVVGSLLPTLARPVHPVLGIQGRTRLQKDPGI